MFESYVIDDLRRLLLRVAANERWYDQEWLGVPIWQLPEDLIRLQRLVTAVRPRWIIETGTKFGGSAIFFGSLLHMLDTRDGGVVTLDIDGKPEAARVFAEHPMGRYVKAVIVGDAADPAMVARAAEPVRADPGPTLVFLDDDHNAEHVLAELHSYAALVTPGSYLVVADTVFGELAETPVGAPRDKYPDVTESNPRIAIDRFLADGAPFERCSRFLTPGVGNFPDGFLKKRSGIAG